MDNYLHISDLNWETAGPQEDASVFLESFVSINSNNFQLLAFKVPLPYSSSDTKNLLWETNDFIKDNHLLWNPENHYTFITEETVFTKNQLIPGINSQYNEHITDAWKRLLYLFKQSNDYWRPSIIEGSAYYIFGYPTFQKKFSSGILNYELDESLEIKNNGNLKHENSYRIMIENTPCVLKTMNLRSLQINKKSFNQLLNDKSNLVLEHFDNSFINFSKSYKRNTVLFDNIKKESIVYPFDTTKWNFDFLVFLEKSIYSLQKNEFSLCLSSDIKTLDFISLFDNLIKNSISENMCLIDQKGYVSFNMDQFYLNKNFNIFNFRNVGLNIIVKKDNNEYKVISSKIFEDMKILDNTIYLKPNNIWLNLVANFKIKKKLSLNEFFNFKYESNLEIEPSWIQKLPILFKKPSSLKFKI